MVVVYVEALCCVYAALQIHLNVLVVQSLGTQNMHVGSNISMSKCHCCQVGCQAVASRVFFPLTFFNFP